MTSFFGKKDTEKRFLISFRKINFKRSLMCSLNKKLKIVISLDPNMKQVFLKSPAFLKKSSIEFFNVSCDQYI